MERTKNIKVEKPKWQKVGGGSLRIGNRIIKSGQVFEALPEEISPSFRKFIIPVSGNANFNTVEKKENIIITGKKAKFTIQPHGKSLFLFDVVQEIGVDEEGKSITKILNEKSLKKEAAEQLVKDLEK